MRAKRECYDDTKHFNALLDYHHDVSVDWFGKFEDSVNMQKTAPALLHCLAVEHLLSSAVRLAGTVFSTF